VGPTEALDSASLLMVIVVEIINDLPAILIVRNDSIHVLKNVSEGLLESSELDLRVEIPQGAKRHVYEEIIRKQISAQGYDIQRFLLIRSFFFDSGKTWVRNDACAQLDKIIEVMSIHRHVGLQMIFHSDSRGTEKFNLDLSKGRADEVSAYLEKGGIKKDRIITKFVGEGQLLNDCGDLADCDELLHQINRTAEFKFIVK
jgi:outer membrane protein OmpA-like peptidoglycan-associated protein